MLLLIARNAKYYVSSTGTIFAQILMGTVHSLRMLECGDLHARKYRHTHKEQRSLKLNFLGVGGGEGNRVRSFYCFTEYGTFHGMCRKMQAMS